MAEETFVDLSSGKLNGQKAFMQGKLKVKGNMMLATKLDAVFKIAKVEDPAPAVSNALQNLASVPGFDSSKVFVQMHAGITSKSAAEKDALLKKIKAIFQFDVKNSQGVTQTWTLDLKNVAGLIVGSGLVKPDIVIALSDDDMNSLANGKLDGQKAFMQGKLKVKGNVMLATKLADVLKSLKSKI